MPRKYIEQRICTSLLININKMRHKKISFPVNFTVAILLSVMANTFYIKAFGDELSAAHINTINNFTEQNGTTIHVDGCKIHQDVYLSASAFPQRKIDIYANMKDISAQLSVSTVDGRYYNTKLVCKSNQECISNKQINKNGTEAYTSYGPEMYILSTDDHRGGSELRKALSALIGKCQGINAVIREVNNGRSAKSVKKDEGVQAANQCPGLYIGKSVKAPTKDLFGPSGFSQAIVLGFSAQTGVATVQAVDNQKMVGEVPCSSLK